MRLPTSSRQQLLSRTSIDPAWHERHQKFRYQMQRPPGAVAAVLLMGLVCVTGATLVLSRERDQSVKQWQTGQDLQHGHMLVTCSHCRLQARPQLAKDTSTPNIPLLLSLQAPRLGQ